MKKWMKRIALLMVICLVITPIEGVNAKSTTYKELSSPYNTWTNGTYNISIKENKLCRQTKKSGKTVTLAKWSLKGDDSLKISTIYNNKAYVLKRSDSGASIPVLYSVDLKTKKKKKVANRCEPVLCKGKYIYANPATVTDVSCDIVDLYKITKTGIKKVKRIGKNVFGTEAKNNKIYYASYPDRSMKKMTMYSCKVNGTGKKKLFTLKGTGQYCQVLPCKITSKYITATNGSNLYKYTFKTKKLKKISAS